MVCIPLSNLLQAPGASAVPHYLKGCCSWEPRGSRRGTGTAWPWVPLGTLAGQVLVNSAMHTVTSGWGRKIPLRAKHPPKKYLPGLILPHPIQMQVDIPSGEAQGSSKYLCDPTMSSGL